MDFFLRAADVVAAQRHRRLLIEAERERQAARSIPRLRAKAIPERAVTRTAGAILAETAGRVGVARRRPAPLG